MKSVERNGPYEKDLRETIIRLHVEEERTIASLSKEYGVSASTISRWIIASKNTRKPAIN